MISSTRRYGFINASPGSSALQGIVACVVVGLSTSGAAFLTYNTPVVGLGCRSGNYIIYGLLALGCFALDMAGGALDDRLRRRQRWRQPRNTTDDDDDNDTRRSDSDSRAMPPLRNILHVALTVLEVASCAQLLSILLGQLIGLYNSCACRASTWSRVAGVGGYVTFETDDYYRAHFDMRRFWLAGTVLGCLPLLSIVFAVHAWCAQSFLWSYDYAKAMRGLRRVRRARYVLHGGWYACFARRLRRLRGRVGKALTATKASLSNAGADDKWRKN
jgi:Ni/Co efflux regulator RcnB